MKARYSPEADALYVRLRQGKIDHTEPLQGDDNRLVDYDVTGTPVGIEILDASRGIDMEGLPWAEELSKAAKRFALPVTLIKQT